MPPQTERLILPRADDFHVHLRQGDMLRMLAPLVAVGGVGRCLVMPNTQPPLALPAAALAYRDTLRQAAPGTDFLLSLYLTPELTPARVQEAAAAGITAVKCYPRGVTTHSDQGVEDLGRYADVFAAMADLRLVLSLHGEMPANPARDICALNAEAAFLGELERLHRTFPRLRIVLEHVTTAEGVACVRALGPTVAATITAHHLDLTVDDWAGRNHNFCKPVAKYPHDREALRAVVGEGHSRFFLGSDSAPHTRDRKECACGCAGVFTAPLLLPYLADTFDRLGCLDRLPDFIGRFGHEFYELPPLNGSTILQRRDTRVPEVFGSVVPYRAGETLRWGVV